MITIQENIRELNFWFDRYAPLTKKSRPEALAHQARNFSFILAKRLRGIQMSKGAITQERMAALKAGEGLRISERAKELVAKRYGAKGKAAKTQAAEAARIMAATGDATLTKRALEAAQEIRLRESHRGFTASAARFRGNMKALTYSKTRQGSTLGQAKPVSGGPEADSFVFDWGSAVSRASAMAATGLSKQKSQKEINNTLTDVRADMVKYITRKQQEAARTAAARIRRL